MDKSKFISALYKLLDTEKPAPVFYDSIINLLQDNLNDTIWNLGIVNESTAKISYFRTDAPFDTIEVDNNVFKKGKQLIKNNLPAGFKWLQVIPLVFNQQKIGVCMCLGRGRRSNILEELEEDLAFLVMQYQLKSKLINDTIMMNSMLMASQQTAASKDITSLIKMVFPTLKGSLSADGIFLYMWEKNEVYCYNISGQKESAVIPHEEASIVKEVKLNARALMVKDVSGNEFYNKEIDGRYTDKTVLNLIAAPVMAAEEVIGVLVAVNDNEMRTFVGSDLVWVKSICSEIGAAIEKIRLYKNVHKLFLSSIEVLAAAIDGKDPYTHGHSRRVTMYSMVIGKEMKLDNQTLEEIRLSALLHDIGKIAIPESILMKPTRLTDSEWNTLKQHPQKGVNMLEPVEEFAPLFGGIKHHHEHYNGKGYPDGLKGENIPLIARIISVADSYDAMTSKRVYRNAMTEDEALNEIIRCKGIQFDPEIAEIFIEVYKKKFYAGSRSAHNAEIV